MFGEAVKLRYICYMENQVTIGIVGGGQLGRMLTLAAKPLGYRVVVLNTQPDSPASKVGAEEIIGNLYDEAALRLLAEQSDYITIEIEHVNADTLEAIAQAGVPVNPAPATIRLIQDKFKQKEHLQAAGVPLAPFMDVANKQSAVQALEKFGGKMLLKTREGAYDGRGNMVIESEQAIDTAFEMFAGRALYAEGFVPFERELAVMVARDIAGSVAVYPVVETVHERNICTEVLAPAQISADQRKKAEAVAHQVATMLEGAGVFGIEMFQTTTGDILVNEIAPRVHNSGHYTTEACRVGQFEQHIRAVSGLPLGSTDMVVPAAAMINILGERNGPTDIQGRAEVLRDAQVSLHLYDKHPTKIDRKMGHITATGNSLEVARARAQTARSQFSI